MSRRPVGSIREVADGKHRVEVKHGTHPITGKPRRMSETVHGTWQEAEVVKARLLLEVGKTPASDLTLRQYLEGMYLPDARSRLRARTVDGYQSIFDAHVVPKLGEVKLTALGAYQLVSWYREVKGSPRTRQHVYRALSTALNEAVRWQLIDFNPMRAVRVPQVTISRPDTLTADEVRGYLAAFQGHVIEPVVILALAAGLRRSELAGLVWADIDFEVGTVAVARGLHDRRGGVLVEDPKSQTSRRIVALAPWALDILRPLRGIGPLVTEDGAPMRPWRISRLYVDHVAAKELRRVQLKNLRHTHACLMLENGVDIYTVSRRLGHSTVGVTEDHYVKPSPDRDRAAAAAFDPTRPTAAGGQMRPIGGRP